jgi:phosphinothricin acetyltransferase
MIRPCRAADAAAVCDIYNYYVRETVVTFEEEPVAVNDMARRIGTTTAGLPWLVWEEDGAVLGYAYAAPWKARSAYRYSAETTVYVSRGHTGRGLGSALYTGLLAQIAGRVHCAIGGISLPNAASVALHEKLGFREIGRFPEVGRKFGRWVDVGYWARVDAGGVAAA